MSDRSSTQAANDGQFVRARHRTLAIPATVTPVANYPRKLRIYRTNASPYWQVRTYLQGRTYTQSLRTTHRGVALRAARDFFHQKVADVYGQQVVPRWPPQTAPLMATQTAPGRTGLIMGCRP